MNYNEGDIIVYRPFGPGTRVVEVEYREEDIKNGMPGFGGIVVEGPDKGMSVWGYDNQIESVR